MKTRVTGILSLTVAITTAILAVILASTEMTAAPVTTLEAKIESLGNLDFLFYLGYIDAALLTLLGVAMFTGFYLYCRADAAYWSAMGVVFVPIYGLGNLVSYLSQVFVVPHLLALYRQPETAAIAQVLLGLAIHNWYGTAIEALNALSYAVLGIPSIIFAVIMFRKAKGLRVGSVLLALSGVLSMVALVGVGLQNALLGMMSIVGGLVYMVSLTIIGLFFLHQPKAEAV
ncbi:MAG: hypothetical protein JXA14_10740 [Anaerolineae bacterium]|nr:hypothetical protein [Anaerolineae bacterium]